MPFVKSAYLSHEGSPREGATSGNISHFAAIRMRVTGTGNLDISWFSLNDIITKSLVPLPMNATDRKEPTRLGGFVSQRAAFKLSTDQLNEYFRINRIVIFTKELWSSYPG